MTFRIWISEQGAYSECDNSFAQNRVRPGKTRLVAMLDESLLKNVRCLLCFNIVNSYLHSYSIYTAPGI